MEIFNSAAHMNLFGMREKISRLSKPLLLPFAGIFTRVTALSADVQRLVSLNGGQLDIYDVVNGEELELVSHRSLVPLWTAASRAMSDGVTGWMSLAPPQAKYLLALSSRGTLLAVALGRTIQIYNLNDDGSDSVESVLEIGSNVSTSAFGFTTFRGMIEGLSFEDHDTLLRLEVGKEGQVTELSRVRYLGNPLPRSGSGNTKIEEHDLMEYWKRCRNDVYVDSVELSKTMRGDRNCMLRGLQLLPTASSTSSVLGRFFVAAMTSSKDNAYCLGYLSESKEVTILSRLPCRRDRLALTSVADINNWIDQGNLGTATSRELAKSIPRWDPCNIAQLMTKRPVISVADDCRLMAVYEQGAGQRVSSSNGDVIYLYRLSGKESMQEIGEQDPDPSGNEPTVVRCSSSEAWPFLLTTLQARLISMKLTSSRTAVYHQRFKSRKYVLDVETEEERSQWLIG